MRLLWLRFLFGLHVTIYRLSGGRLLGRLVDLPVLILHTVGRKTGKQRITPLTYLPDGDRMVITASFGGAAQHPDWYFNLKAHPQTTVEIAGQMMAVVATEADAAERAKLWQRLIAIAPIYTKYQHRTERVIPMLILRQV